jgi:hypothetical protein
MGHHHHHDHGTDGRVVAGPIAPEALQFFSAYAQSDEMKRLSMRYQRFSMEDHTALEELQEDLEALERGGDIPVEMLAFMRYAVDMEIGALGKKHRRPLIKAFKKVANDTPEQAETRAKLDGLRDYLASLEAQVPKRPKPEAQAAPIRPALKEPLRLAWWSAVRTKQKVGSPVYNVTKRGYDAVSDFLHNADFKSKLPHKHRLPEHHRHLLTSVRHHTSQGLPPWYRADKHVGRGLKWLHALMLDTFEHIGEAALENKMKAALYAATFLMVWDFMQTRGAVSQTTYVEQELLRVEKTSIDDFYNLDMADLEAPDFSFELAEKTDKDQPLASHDHLAYFVSGENAAERAALAEALREKYPWLENLPLRHQMKVLDFADEAGNSFDFVWENFLSRAYDFVGLPSEDLGNAVLNGSKKEAYLAGAEHAQDLVVGYNTAENSIFHPMVLHFCLMASLAAMVHGAGRKLNNEEVSEHLKIIGNFLNSSIRTSPLTYATTLAGALTPVLAKGELDFSVAPTMLWSAVLGGVIGETIHKTLRLRNGGAHASAMNDVHRVLEDGAFAQYAGAYKPPRQPLLAQMIDIMHETPQTESRTEIAWGAVQDSAGYHYRNMVTPKSLVTKGLAVTAITWAAHDVKNNDAQHVMNAAGHAVVIGTFVCYDAIEDNVAHVVFGGAGMLGGVALGAGFLLAAGGVRLTRMDKLGATTYRASGLSKVVDVTRSGLATASSSVQDYFRLEYEAKAGITLQTPANDDGVVTDAGLPSESLDLTYERDLEAPAVRL